MIKMGELCQILHDLVPTIDLDNIPSTSNTYYTDEETVEILLNKYFHKKLPYETLTQDAEKICKLFPSTTFEHVRNLLQKYRELSNRNEIVIAILYRNKRKSQIKAPPPPRNIIDDNPTSIPDSMIKDIMAPFLDSDVDVAVNSNNLKRGFTDFNSPGEHPTKITKHLEILNNRVKEEVNDYNSDLGNGYITALQPNESVSTSEAPSATLDTAEIKIEEAPVVKSEPNDSFHEDAPSYIEIEKVENTENLDLKLYTMPALDYSNFGQNAGKDVNQNSSRKTIVANVKPSIAQPFRFGAVHSAPKRCTVVSSTDTSYRNIPMPKEVSSFIAPHKFNENVTSTPVRVINWPSISNSVGKSQGFEITDNRMLTMKPQTITAPKSAGLVTSTAQWTSVSLDNSLKQIKTESDALTTIIVDEAMDEHQMFSDSVIDITDESSPFRYNMEPDENTETIDDDLDTSYNNPLVIRMCDIFPDACPNYIRKICRKKTLSDAHVNELISMIIDSNGSYPKRPPVSKSPEPENSPQNQLEILKELLPDADPDFLSMKFEGFNGNSEQMKTFLNEAIEKKNYPTMREYNRRKQLSAQQQQYTTKFNVENFVKIIPDPKKFFSDPTRTFTMDNLATHYSLTFLKNIFNVLSVRVIQSTFMKLNFRLYPTVCELRHSGDRMKTKRKLIELPKFMQSIPLLQEIAFITHEEEINQYLLEKKVSEQRQRAQYKKLGLIYTCNCCFDDDVLPKDSFKCPTGCIFCRSCMEKSTEVLFGQGKVDFPCLMNCGSDFGLQTLQSALTPKFFSKLAQKKALAEVKAAEIEELEMCPFCDFATIPAEGDRIFKCLNSECMKESCRLCKEPSHIPLRCDEIEKDQEVKARVFVEDKMTEALVRKCYQCSLRFFKEEGCNMMTCSCGAHMCYICGKPVKDYKHFNGNGGDRMDLCPLYSDTNKLNKENVLKAAEAAKVAVGTSLLKSDPTADVQKHYNSRAAKLPKPILPPDINHAIVPHLQYLERAFRRQRQHHQN